MTGIRVRRLFPLCASLLLLGACAWAPATPTGQPSATGAAPSPTAPAPSATASPAGPDVAIVGMQYRAATHVEGVLERVSDDKGGVLQVHLRNAGTTGAVVRQLLLDGKTAASYTGDQALTWWRVWPETIPSGGTATLTMHARGGPLAAGRSLSVTVTGAGFSASASVTLEEPALRIASVVRGDDAATLLMFVRNDSADRTFRILGPSSGEVPIDGTVRPASGLVGPGELGLLEVRRDTPFRTLEPLVLRVDARDAASGALVAARASLRLTEPYFPIGTWGGIAWDTSAPDLPTMRGLGIGSVVGSLVSFSGLSPYSFGMRTLDFTGEPPGIDLVRIRARRDDPDAAAIMLKDEPEWSEQMTTADVAQAHLLAARTTATIPTYLNLCVSKRFGEFAAIADIVSMDHYAYYAPLANDLPIPHKVAEAGWYMQALKRQAEPRPVWAWSQYAGWDRDPPGWSVENQAWQILAEGAKGLYWFNYGEGAADEYPEQTAALSRVDRQLELVKGVLLRGEPYAGGVSAQGSGSLLARVVAGRDAALLVLVNLDDRASLTFSGFQYTLRAQAGVRCDIRMPAWLEDGPVHEVTPEGLVATEWSGEGGRLRMTVDVPNVRVFLLGAPDREAPSAPTRVQRVDWPDGTSYLCWREAVDGTGIHSYEILAGGRVVAQVRAPIWRIPEGEAARYEVRAVDAFGNEGPSAAMQGAG